MGKPPIVMARKQADFFLPAPQNRPIPREKPGTREYLGAEIRVECAGATRGRRLPAAQVRCELEAGSWTIADRRIASRVCEGHRPMPATMPRPRAARWRPYPAHETP